MANIKDNKGFTLIELSIVIVIIGLIVAGVVGGQSLVRQAKVRGIITEYNQYMVATNSFKLEYDGLPGDLINANDYGIGTSGDGNKLIYGANVGTGELYYSFAHLANAGLIKGQFTGADAGTPDFQIGVNIPKSSFGNNVTALFTSVDLAGQNCMVLGSNPLFGLHSRINIITFAQPQAGVQGCPRSGFLKVNEAYGIDQKIDDGSADSGIMFSANTIGTNTDGNRCVDNVIDGTGGASYDFNETGENCRLLFKIGL